MSVLSIESTTIKDDYVIVEAIIGDAGLISRGTRWSPPEYAPAFADRDWETKEICLVM